MIKNGVYEHTGGEYEIEIEPWEQKKERLPKPVPCLGNDFLKAVFGFEDLENWHYVFPSGDIGVSNADPRFVVEVGKRSLICVRAEYLAESRVSLINQLKTAARKQLKKYSPGIIFVLLNSKLYGLGRYRRIDVIVSDLSSELEKMLRDYSRIYKIIVDIVSESDEFPYITTSQRLEATNKDCKTPTGYVEPKPILMV